MISWLGFVVVVLAAYRVTRLVTTDSITERARDRLYRWAWIEPNEPDAYRAAWSHHKPDVPWDDYAVEPLPRQGGLRTYINELFNCPWCFGVWVSYAVLAVWWWAVRDGGSIVRFLIIGAAVAGAQGFLASRADA